MVKFLLGTRWIRHLLFWIVILFFHVSRSNLNFVGYSREIFIAEIAEHGLMLPLLAIASYFTAYYLIPLYYFTKKYIAFTVLLFVSAIIFIFSMRLLLYYIINPYFYTSFSLKFPGFMQFNIFQHFFYIYSTVAIVIMIKISRDWYNVVKQKEQLQQQNSISELALLKAQVNPHFLFNTLNNLNVLIKKDTELSSKYIIKLSEITRYMLYEASAEQVKLSKEIEYLDNFIKLNQIRYKDTNFVTFEIKGDPSKIEIAPILFMPFVENAFKHANKEIISPGIIINMSITSTGILFNVFNYKKMFIDNFNEGYNGIGINNVRRRLELIYPGKHELNIRETDKDFFVSLQLYM